jgi:hypothetical protein
MTIWGSELKTWGTYTSTAGDLVHNAVPVCLKAVQTALNGRAWWSKHHPTTITKGLSTKTNTSTKSTPTYRKQYICEYNLQGRKSIFISMIEETHSTALFFTCYNAHAPPYPVQVQDMGSLHHVYTSYNYDTRCLYEIQLWYEVRL